MALELLAAVGSGCRASIDLIFTGITDIIRIIFGEQFKINLNWSYVYFLIEDRIKSSKR
jgi:hypothetical protein